MIIPALTALAVWAYMGAADVPAEKPAYIQKGYDFIRGVRESGRGDLSEGAGEL